MWWNAGNAFYKECKEDYSLKCTDIIVNEAWLNYLYFQDFEAYKNNVCGFGPDYLIHLGTHTDIEFFVTNQEVCYQTNTASVENLTHIANELDISLVYISTAGIF